MFDIFPKGILSDIRPLDLSVYEAKTEEYADYFSRQGGVLWIGQFGSIRTPGVSDLDLMLVCRDEHYETVNSESQRFVRQSPLHRYVFWHDVSVVPQSIVKYLFYMHSLENLKRLWSISDDILDRCEQPEELVILFRTILYNSFFWSLLSSHCQRDRASLRLTLLLSKNALTSAANNYRLMEKEDSTALVLRSEQERRHVLDARPEDQGDFAKAYFKEAIQTLYRADWELNNWVSGKFMLEMKKQKHLLLLENHIIIFDDTHDQNKILSRLFDRTIITLPSFYHTVGCLVVKPYLRLCPGLAKVWDITEVVERTASTELRLASIEWNETLHKIFDSLENVGSDPRDYELVEFPFNLKGAKTNSYMRVTSVVNRLIKHIPL